MRMKGHVGSFSKHAHWFNGALSEASPIAPPMMNKHHTMQHGYILWYLQIKYRKCVRKWLRHVSEILVSVPFYRDNCIVTLEVPSLSKSCLTLHDTRLQVTTSLCSRKTEDNIRPRTRTSTEHLTSLRAPAPPPDTWRLHHRVAPRTTRTDGRNSSEREAGLQGAACFL